MSRNPPLPLPLRPRLDFGLRVRRHAYPADPACSGVHFRSVPRFASGFFPTRPHGASRLSSHDVANCVQLPLARGCYQLAPRRTYTSNPVPMPGTPSATKALDPDPFPCRSLRHAVYAALLHFGLETAGLILFILF